MAIPRLVWIAALVLVALGPAAPAGASTPGSFVDDDGVPGERYIERLQELGVVHGCNPPVNDRFCPTGTVSRAEAAKVLVLAGQRYGRLPGLPSVAGPFVDDDELWGGALSRFTTLLAREGIVHGCNPPANDRFCPGARLDRAAITKMVVAAFGLEAPSSFRSPWGDTRGRWYEEAARVAAHHGLWDESAGRFDGQRPITRAELARVVVEAAGERLCPSDPFTEGRVGALEARHPRQAFSAYAYDLASTCAYWMNPETRLRTASVFKVMVMAGTLLEAQEAGRVLTPWERSRLEPMISESANQPVRDLWNSFGGSPWFRDQARRFGMDDTRTVGDNERGWGLTTTSAKDQGDLLRQVLLGHWGPLEAPGRAEALALMSSVVPSQSWGVTAGVPDDWQVAQKNGFAGIVANSVGLISDGNGSGYVLVVLSNGWPTWRHGVAAVEQISEWVASELAR